MASTSRSMAVYEEGSGAGEGVDMLGRRYMSFSSGILGTRQIATVNKRRLAKAVVTNNQSRQVGKQRRNFGCITRLEPSGSCVQIPRAEAETEPRLSKRGNIQKQETRIV